MITRYSKTYTIRALHSLENPDASNEENERLYGMCYRLHGHHYRVIVSLQADFDQDRGLAQFRLELDQVVKRVLLDRFDMKNLNESFKNTSGEALVHLFFELLRPEIPAAILLKISIQETRKNFFELPRFA